MDMEWRPYPNESAEYRKARNELLEAEEGLRRELERVAALRRALPLGGELPEDYAFEERDPQGRVRKTKLSELFASGLDSLLLYGFMFGPKMERACPMCTSFLDSLDGAAPHLGQRINLAVCARSPVERIAAHAASRGWSKLRLLSSADNGYAHDYLTEGDDGSQWPMANVFVRRGGRIHHFWGSELMFRSSPSGNTRHIDLAWPLWNVLDWMPEGRGKDWYPALEYAPGPAAGSR
jgi:predicted dithiol-disulfide oxidoreductase (DUF899 family)